MSNRNIKCKFTDENGACPKTATYGTVVNGKKVR